MKLIKEFLINKNKFFNFELKSTIREIIFKKLKINIPKENIFISSNQILIKIEPKPKIKIILLKEEILTELKHQFPKIIIKDLK